MTISRLNHLFAVIVLFLIKQSISERACTEEFYCDGRYLLPIGQSKAFADSKTIVDLVMRSDWNLMKDEFTKELDAAGNDSDRVRQVVGKYFLDPGSELKEIVPQDWQPKPKIFGDSITQNDYKSFAYHLNDLWKMLCREQIPDLNLNRTSFLPIQYPNLVPGGRFLEVYYWDSYWTAKGALVSGMSQTVRHMILNMVDRVRQFGFVPNGGRVYYKTRSQPPVLTLMVADYFENTKDIEFVRSIIDDLYTEFSFWLENRSVQVDGQPDDVILFQYRTNITQERPESFIQDHRTALEAVEKMNRTKEQVFVDLSSAAESGWDFSSRWLAYSGKHMYRLYSIRTTKIVPVCLNSILYSVAIHLSEFSQILGDSAKSTYFQDVALKIKKGISMYLWDGDHHQWYDYDLEEKANHRATYASNYFPLWAKSHDLNQAQLDQLIDHLDFFDLLKFDGGFITSHIATNEQWDSPNAWPPLQDIIIQGLLNVASHNSTNLAKQLAEKWVNNNFDTFRKTGNMFEKYSAVDIGYPGGGGEYDVQVGFGWTNGVALNYLVKYGSELWKTSSANNNNTFTIVIVVLSLFSAACLVFAATVMARANKKRQQSPDNAIRRESGNEEIALGV